jgi:peptidoglycan/LPS O-acetylase OafA/YrhL
MIFVYHPTHADIQEIIRLFTFTANNSLALPFLGVLSIVSTEMQFYVVAPLFVVLFNYLFKKNTLVAIIFPFLLSYSVKLFLVKNGFVATDVPGYVVHIYTQVHGNLDYFLMGMITSYVLLKKPYLVEVIKRIPGGILLPYLFLLFEAASFVYFNKSAWVFENYRTVSLFCIPSLLTTGMALLIIKYINPTYRYTSQNQTIRTLIQRLTNPVTILAAIGSISYGVYLWHSPFLSILFGNSSSFMVNWSSFIIRFLSVTIFSIVAAVCVYFLVEKPLQKLKKYY